MRVDSCGTIFKVVWVTQPRRKKVVARGRIEREETQEREKVGGAK
jgi:hypothetical protein